MEALKLAFETVIVGLFALPWLWLMIDLVNPGLFSSPAVRRLGALVPSELRAAAIGLALFSIVYLLGSMITPVACEFLDDPDMLGEYLPTQQRIQAWVYNKMTVRPPIPNLDVPKDKDIALVAFRDPQQETPEWKTAKHYRESVDDEFQKDESTLLLKGPDATERLNRLHEQVTVLRGASFSAFTFSMLCFFAWCARSKNANTAMGSSVWQLARWRSGILISSGIMIWAFKTFWNDSHGDSGDIPVAELVFLGLSGFGMYVLIWGKRSRLQFHGPAFVFSLCFAALCFGGYGSVATSYDQGVFNAYVALSPAATGDGSHAIDGSKIAAITGAER